MYNYKYIISFLLISFYFCAGFSIEAAVQPENRNSSVGFAGDEYVPNKLVLSFADGPVYVNTAGSSEWKRVEGRYVFSDKDGLRTGAHGYAVLTWSSCDLILIKPESSMRFSIKSPESSPRLTVMVYEASIMTASRDSGAVEIEGRRGALTVANGEASYSSNYKCDMVRALAGKAAFKAKPLETYMEIPEGYGLDLDENGGISALTPYDVRMEYSNWRRFNTWLEKFRNFHKQISTEIDYKVDSVLVNGAFLSALEVDRAGFRMLDPGAGAVPKQLYIKLKITPYPRPDDRFELYLSKDLIYPLREGREGFFEALIPTPSFPEVKMAVHYLDSLGRRSRIFYTQILILNKRQRIEDAKLFLEKLSMAMARRDNIYLREHISKDYKDWFGNTWFDFVKMFDDSLHEYRDIRLTLAPHTFTFKDDALVVKMYYRLSALTGNWTWRYDDKGVDILTLKYEDGDWRIRSKSKGLFFQRMKVAVDLRLGVLRGRVTDERTGAPIYGAEVKITPRGLRTSTDSMGEYIVYNIPPGIYNVEISKNGYGTLTAMRVEIVPSGQRH